MTTAGVSLGLVACALLAACGHAVETSPSKVAATCVPPAQWAVPQAAGPEAQPANRVLARFAEAQVVLLGETHDNADHHRWELSTIAGLYALHPHMVLGFEMFPRRAQPALDEWVAGRTSEAEFLAQSDWRRVWGFDASLYLPIFQFARLHHIPMVALNVDRQLVSRVGDEGWSSVLAADREGVTDPAPASREYLQSLYPTFLAHSTTGSHPGPSVAPPTEAQLAEPPFRRFVDGMLVWDRAMAQGIAEQLRGADPPLVVAIMGSGHVRYGYGVPHQLRDLGVRRVTVTLPWDPGTPCSDLTPALADAVYELPPLPAAAQEERPRLGITIERVATDVVVRQVAQGSVAERAGFLSGDVIVEVAGVPVHDTSDVIAAVRRQPPGTWLPILVKRGGETLELVARFPARQ